MTRLLFKMSNLIDALDAQVRLAENELNDVAPVVGWLAGNSQERKRLRKRVKVLREKVSEAGRVERGNA